MRMIRWLVAGTIVAVMLVPLARPAAAPNPPVDPLEGDSRMQRRIALSVEGLPIRDLLGLVSGRTGVSLAAAGDVGDEKALVFTPAGPLRDLLADLAALFDCRWVREGRANESPRYRLVRSRDSQQREARLLRKRMERLIAQLDAQVRALRKTPEQLARRAESDPIRRSLSDPGGRLAAEFYSLLTAPQRQQLFSRMSLTVPFAGLTSAQQAPLRARFAQEMADLHRMNEEFARRQREEGRDERLTLVVPMPGELEQGLLRFVLHNWRGSVDARLVPGPQIGELTAHPERLLPVRGDPYSGEAVAEDAPLPPIRSVRDADREAAWPDRLRTLAQKARIPVLADYYRGQFANAASGARADNGETRTPAEALDGLADREGYLWWTRGKALLFRKRDWYFQRLYEVPDRWMISMIARLNARRRELSYADVGQLLDLTPAQIEGMDRLQAIYPPQEEYEMPRLRALLALIAAAPNAADLPVMHSAAFTPEVQDRVTLSAPLFSPRQRSLLIAFAQAQDRPVSAEAVAAFRTYISHHSGQPETARRGYRYVPVVVTWEFGKELSSGYFLYLPASLPDDRRAKTRIDLPEAAGESPAGRPA